MYKMSTVTSLALVLAFAGADRANAIIVAEGDVAYDFNPVSGTLSPALTPQDVRVGRTAQGRLRVDGGSRLRMEPGSGFDPDLVVARRTGSNGSSVLIDNGAIDLLGHDIAGGVNVQIGRESSGSMTIRNGGALNLVNPDRGNPDVGGAALSVGRSSRGELVLDNGTVTLDSEDSSIAIGREGAAAVVTLRNGSAVTVLDDGPLDPDRGAVISVGHSGLANATMTVEDSDVTVRSTVDARIFVGRESAVGRLDVSGSASNVLIDGPDSKLVVGRDAGSIGRVRFDQGARVLISGDDAGLEIARSDGSDGAVVIEGGALVEVAGRDAGARVAADVTGFGSLNDGGVGRLDIRGPGSALRVQDAVIAGSPASFGGTGTPSAAIVLADGGSITANQVIIGRGASLSGNGGSVTGTLVNDGGLIAPGFSPGSITVDAFVQTAGTLLIEVAGLAPGEFDVLNVLGDAVFSGGAIEFSFIEGFLPSAGDVIPFLTATGGIEIVDTDFLIDGLGPGFDFSVRAENGRFALLANNDALAVDEPLIVWMVIWGLAGLGLFVLARRPRTLCRSPGR
ncbi:MAG: hypothetical protein R3F54_10550 [Alphaproteobacteria bacterium]